MIARYCEVCGAFARATLRPYPLSREGIMRDRSAFSPWVWFLFAAGLVAILPPGAAPAQKKESPPAQGEKPAPAVLKVFRLRNASAHELVRELTRMFGPAR